jgi:DNA-binding PucR family transcriptional regulator
LGHAVAFQHAPESARRARLALGLARDGFVDSGARLVDILLAGDAGLARDLSERALAPLAELPPNRRARLLETLAAWLDAHGDVRAASEALHVHTQTVRYRLNQLRELFGDALEDPAARLELALALRVTS